MAVVNYIFSFDSWCDLAVFPAHWEILKVVFSPKGFNPVCVISEMAEQIFFPGASNWL